MMVFLLVSETTCNCSYSQPAPREGQTPGQPPSHFAITSSYCTVCFRSSKHLEIITIYNHFITSVIARSLDYMEHIVRYSHPQHKKKSTVNKRRGLLETKQSNFNPILPWHGLFHFLVSFITS